MNNDLIFIVYAPRYDSKSGGSIALHKLCHIINLLGEKAYIWPMGKPQVPQSPLISWIFRASAYYISRIYRKPYCVRQDFITPLAQRNDISRAVIIYPEIVNGNPLGGVFIVRWLLYKPSFYKKKINYLPKDIFFYYQNAFLDSNLSMINSGPLFVVEYFRNIYRQWNYGSREGVCYIIRKGKSRLDLPPKSKLKNFLIVDNFPHEELAQIFNRYKYCFSYDVHTMYMTYASLCGCIPVVIPLEGVSKEEWQPVQKYTYGIAYGLDDIDYALSTRELLISRIHDDEEQNHQMVSRFISVVKSHFNF